jgi:hypothetical protein
MTRPQRRLVRRGRVVVSDCLGRLDKLDEPPSLAALRDQVDALIPIERTVPHDRTRLHEYNIISPRC